MEPIYYAFIVGSYLGAMLWREVNPFNAPLLANYWFGFVFTLAAYYFFFEMILPYLVK